MSDDVREDEFTVEGRLLTDVGGTIPVKVLSTPGMIGMMERTAAMLALEKLPDGREVLERADIPGDVSVSVLIPNERGLDNALELRERFQEINVFLSASETHNRKNVNRSVEESLAGLERVLPRAREAGLRCE